MAESGNEADSARAKVIFAYLAEVEGLLNENADLINPESKIKEFIKPYSVQLKDVAERLYNLEEEKQNEMSRFEQHERESLVEQFSKEGKELTLSADTVKKVPIDALREMLNNTKPTIPIGRQFKVLNTTGNENIPTSREGKAAAFQKYFHELAKA